GGGGFLQPELAEAGGRGRCQTGLPLPPTALRGGPFPPRFAPGDKGVGLCPPRSGGRFLPPELAEAGGRGQVCEAGPFPPRFAPGDKGVGLCPPRSGGRSLPPELAEAGGRGQAGDGLVRFAGVHPPRFARGDKASGFRLRTQNPPLDTTVAVDACPTGNTRGDEDFRLSTHHPPPTTGGGSRPTGNL